MTAEITYRSIGTIHTPFTDEAGMPIQCGFSDASGTVEVDPEFEDGLRDLDGFSHLVLVYHFHRSDGYELGVQPYLEDETRGLFATRAPRRPNPIGLSVVEVTGISGTTISVDGIDVLDGTPLLDIKPYVPQFDGVEEVQIGWMADVIDNEDRHRADNRFLD